jgi:hypothetical protein
MGVSVEECEDQECRAKSAKHNAKEVQMNNKIVQATGKVYKELGILG